MRGVNTMMLLRTVYSCAEVVDGKGRGVRRPQLSPLARKGIDHLVKDFQWRTPPPPNDTHHQVPITAVMPLRNSYLSLSLPIAPVLEH